MDSAVKVIAKKMRHRCILSGYSGIETKETWSLLLGVGFTHTCVKEPKDDNVGYREENNGGKLKSGNNYSRAKACMTTQDNKRNFSYYRNR